MASAVASLSSPLAMGVKWCVCVVYFNEVEYIIMYSCYHMLPVDVVDRDNIVLKFSMSVFTVRMLGAAWLDIWQRTYMKPGANLLSI